MLGWILGVVVLLAIVGSLAAALLLVVPWEPIMDLLGSMLGFWGDLSPV